jgi:hypothetical protein
MSNHIFLRILRVLVTIVFAWVCLLTLILLLPEVSKMVNDKQVFVSIRTSNLQVGNIQSISMSGSGQVITIDSSGDAVINVAHDGNESSPNTWLIAASHGPHFLTLLALAWLLWLVRAVTYTLGTNWIFSFRNVRRIRGIGLLVIVIKLLSLAPWLLAKAYIIDALNKNHIHFTTNSHYTLINELFLGVLIIGLAEVFRQGMLLKEEHALTI